MEAADFSIMGRHKHNALTAIHDTEGVKNANPTDYIFDLRSTAMRLWDKHSLWKRLVSSAIGSWNWGLLRTRSKRCSELVLMDIRIMNAQWKNSVSPKLRPDLGTACLKTSKKITWLYICRWTWVDLFIMNCLLVLKRETIPCMGQILNLGTNLYMDECALRRICMGRICRRRIAWGRIVTDSP